MKSRCECSYQSISRLPNESLPAFPLSYTVYVNNFFVARNVQDALCSNYEVLVPQILLLPKMTRGGITKFLLKLDPVLKTSGSAATSMTFWRTEFFFSFPEIDLFLFKIRFELAAFPLTTHRSISSRPNHVPPKCKDKGYNPPLSVSPRRASKKAPATTLWTAVCGRFGMDLLVCKTLDILSFPPTQ